jgi:Gelsolin repeat
MESLERASIRTEGLYLLFNTFTIYVYVGKTCDPYYVQQLFKVDDVL